MNKIMEAQEAISLSINEGKIGDTLKVIVDREDSEFYVGRTQFDSPEVDGEVLISKEIELNIGDFYDVTIESAYPFDLIGSVR